MLGALTKKECLALEWKVTHQGTSIFQHKLILTEEMRRITRLLTYLLVRVMLEL